MNATVVQLKTKPQKTTHTRVDTVSFTNEDLKKWKRPPFQRDIKHTKKHGDAVEFIKASGGVIPGVLTLGVLNGTGEVFRVDGNHRLNAFDETGLATGYADVRYYYGTMAELAEEYRRLNEQISPTKPDDRLRAAELSNDKIEKLRTSCKVLAYSPRKDGTQISISMSSVLRAWANAIHNTPIARGTARSAIDVIENMTNADTDSLITLLLACQEAWGRDKEYSSLYGQMNMTVVMWLYLRIVVLKPSKLSRVGQVSMDLFRKCLMSLSADSRYAEWLVGRNGQIHRSPCYQRVKSLFVARLRQDTGVPHKLPQPEWSSNSGSCK